MAGRLDWRQLLCGALLGCMIGALAGAWVQRSASRRVWRRGPDAEKVVERLSEKLGLVEAQRAAVKAVVDFHHAKIMALRHETDARFDEARRAMNAEIRFLLTPQQQEKLDRIAALREERHRRRKEKK